MIDANSVIFGFCLTLIALVVLDLIRARTARREAENATPEPCPRSPGGEHEYGNWEDWERAPRSGSLIQTRRCKHCGLAQEARTIPRVWD
jgi:hypothetical protein